VLCSQLKVQVEGSSKISLYVYDNNTFIVESFLDQETAVKIVTSTQFNRITDLNSSQVFNAETRMPRMSYIEKSRGPKSVYSITVKPHSFRVFKME